MPPKTPEEIRQEQIQKAHDKAMGKTLPETIAVDVSTIDPKAKVGGQVNSRQKINVQLEDGRVVKGFYTEDSFTDYNRQFQDALQEAIDSYTAAFPQNVDENIKFAPGLELLNKLKKDFSVYDFLVAMVEGSGSDVPEEIFSSSLFNGANACTDFFLRHLGGEEYKEKYAELFDDKKVSEIFRSLGKKGVPIGFGYGANIGKAQLSEDARNVNRRNNALYEVSKLLGHDELICQSVNMTTTSKDGSQKYGSFMVNAKGKDIGSIQSYIYKGRPVPMKYSGKGKRDLSRLQVLDYICGNADRHSGNFFYDIKYVEPTEPNSPGELVIQGLQGIDNDMSFGRLTGTGEGVSGFMSNLGDIKVIDKDQMDAILNPDFAPGFEAQMRLLNLSQEEIAAGLGRLSALQEKLKTGTGIQVIDSEEKWNNLNTDDLVAKTDEDNINIWGQAKDIINVASGNPNATIDEFLYPDPELYTVSEAKNESSRLLFHSQLEDLKKLKEDFDKTNPEKASKEFKNMYDGLNKLINKIEKIKDKDSLTDRQFNDISMGFKDVMDNTREYIRLKPKNPFTKSGKDRLHCAKNMLAQAEKGRHMVLEENTAAFNRRMTAEYKKFNKDYKALVDIDKALADKNNLPTQEYCINSIKAINEMSKKKTCDLKLQVAAGYLQKKLLKNLGEETCKSLLSKEELTACSETIKRSNQANDTMNPKQKTAETQTVQNKGAEMSVGNGLL